MKSAMQLSPHMFCAFCVAPFQRLWDEIMRWGKTLEDGPTISDCDDYKRVRCDCSGRQKP